MSPKSFARAAAVEQRDCRLAGRGRQVHVPERRREILVAGKLLDRLRRGSAHREMRTERVPQDVARIVVEDASTRIVSASGLSKKTT